jgi:DNA repair exonuclease SbcCD nuclease subunit
VATIVHAADLHIDRIVQGPSSLSADLIRATRRTVVRLVDLVLTERADLLVISGDVFDRTADTATAGRFFAAQMGRLREAGVPVLVGAGNHDLACPLATSYATNVHWFPADAADSVVLDHLGVAVHGQGLPNPVEPSDLTTGFPAPVPGHLNLGVLHTSLDGLASRSRCAPTSVAALAAVGYDYWALGHVHQRTVVATDPWIVYAGTLQGRGPDEPGPKGATVITAGPGAVTSVTHRELAAFRWGPIPVQRVGVLVDSLG